MNGSDVLADVKDVSADVPIVGPGKAEKLLEARLRLEKKRKKAEKEAEKNTITLMEKDRRQALYDKKEKASKNYQMALKEFGDKYFPQYSYYGFNSLDEEEKEALAQICLKRSKRYVAVNLFLLPASLAAIIYASTTFAGGWLFGLLPWALYYFITTLSPYGRDNKEELGADYHFKFLRPKMKLARISKKEKLLLESKEAKEREKLANN